MGLIFDLAGEPRPRLRREGWGLHARWLGTLQKGRKKDREKLKTCVMNFFNARRVC